MRRRNYRFVYLALSVMCGAGFLLGACGRSSPRKAEASRLQHLEAENLVSEAQFALSLRDYARAEGLFAKATALCPEVGDYWLSLGATRIRLANRSGAKTAYESALSAFRDEAAGHRDSPAPVLQQIYVLTLLGRNDDAQAALRKLEKDFPADRDVRSFVDEKQLDRMRADPVVKDISL